MASNLLSGIFLPNGIPINRQYPHPFPGCGNCVPCKANAESLKATGRPGTRLCKTARSEHFQLGFFDVDADTSIAFQLSATQLTQEQLALRPKAQHALRFNLAFNSAIERIHSKIRIAEQRYADLNRLMMQVEDRFELTRVADRLYVSTSTVHGVQQSIQPSEAEEFALKHLPTALAGIQELTTSERRLIEYARRVAGATIQRIGKGFIGRRLFKQRVQFLRETAACVIIQAAFRRHAAVRLAAIRRWRLRRWIAAMVLQKHFRAFCARCELAKLQREDREQRAWRAVVQFQSVIRGWLVRRHRREVYRQQALANLRFMRDILQKGAVRAMIKQDREFAAAVSVQRVVRGLLGRRDAYQRRQMKLVTNPRVRALADQFLMGGDFWGFMAAINADYERADRVIQQEMARADTFIHRIVGQRAAAEEAEWDRWQVAKETGLMGLELDGDGGEQRQGRRGGAARRGGSVGQDITQRPPGIKGAAASTVSDKKQLFVERTYMQSSKRQAKEEALVHGTRGGGRRRSMTGGGTQHQGPGQGRAATVAEMVAQGGSMFPADGSGPAKVHRRGVNDTAAHLAGIHDVGQDAKLLDETSEGMRVPSGYGLGSGFQGVPEVGDPALDGHAVDQVGFIDQRSAMPGFRRATRLPTHEYSPMRLLQPSAEEVASAARTGRKTDVKDSLLRRPQLKVGERARDIQRHVSDPNTAEDRLPDGTLDLRDEVAEDRLLRGEYMAPELSRLRRSSLPMMDLTAPRSSAGRMAARSTATSTASLQRRASLGAMEGLSSIVQNPAAENVQSWIDEVQHSRLSQPLSAYRPAVVPKTSAVAQARAATEHLDSSKLSMISSSFTTASFARPHPRAAAGEEADLDDPVAAAASFAVQDVYAYEAGRSAPSVAKSHDSSVATAAEEKPVWRQPKLPAHAIDEAAHARTELIPARIQGSVASPANFQLAREYIAGLRGVQRAAASRAAHAERIAAIQQQRDELQQLQSVADADQENDEAWMRQHFGTRFGSDLGDPSRRSSTSNIGINRPHTASGLLQPSAVELGSIIEAPSNIHSGVTTPRDESNGEGGARGLSSDTASSWGGSVLLSSLASTSHEKQLKASLHPSLFDRQAIANRVSDSIRDGTLLDSLASYVHTQTQDPSFQDPDAPPQEVDMDRTLGIERADVGGLPPLYEQMKAEQAARRQAKLKAMADTAKSQTFLEQRRDNVPFAAKVLAEQDGGEAIKAIAVENMLTAGGVQTPVAGYLLRDIRGPTGPIDKLVLHAALRLIPPPRPVLAKAKISQGLKDLFAQAAAEGAVSSGHDASTAPRAANDDNIIDLGANIEGEEAAALYAEWPPGLVKVQWADAAMVYCEPALSAMRSAGMTTVGDVRGQDLESIGVSPLLASTIHRLVRVVETAAKLTRPSVIRRVFAHAPSHNAVEYGKAAAVEELQEYVRTAANVGQAQDRGRVVKRGPTQGQHPGEAVLNTLQSLTQPSRATRARSGSASDAQDAAMHRRPRAVASFEGSPERSQRTWMGDSLPEAYAQRKHPPRSPFVDPDDLQHDSIYGSSSAVLGTSKSAQTLIKTQDKGGSKPGTGVMVSSASASDFWGQQLATALPAGFGALSVDDVTAPIKRRGSLREQLEREERKADVDAGGTNRFLRRLNQEPSIDSSTDTAALDASGRLPQATANSGSQLKFTGWQGVIGALGEPDEAIHGDWTLPDLGGHGEDAVRFQRLLSDLHTSITSLAGVDDFDSPMEPVVVQAAYTLPLPAPRLVGMLDYKNGVERTQLARERVLIPYHVFLYYIALLQHQAEAQEVIGAKNGSPNAKAKAATAAKKARMLLMERLEIAKLLAEPWCEALRQTQFPTVRQLLHIPADQISQAISLGLKPTPPAHAHTPSLHLRVTAIRDVVPIAAVAEVVHDLLEAWLERSGAATRLLESINTQFDRRFQRTALDPVRTGWGREAQDEAKRSLGLRTTYGIRAGAGPESSLRMDHSSGYATVGELADAGRAKGLRSQAAGRRVGDRTWQGLDNPEYRDLPDNRAEYYRQGAGMNVGGGMRLGVTMGSVGYTGEDKASRALEEGHTQKRLWEEAKAVVEVPTMKPHECTVPGCGQRFARAHTLKLHQRAHVMQSEIEDSAQRVRHTASIQGGMQQLAQHRRGSSLYKAPADTADSQGLQRQSSSLDGRVATQIAALKQSLQADADKPVRRKRLPRA